MADSIIAEIKKIPQATRYIIGSSLAVTLSAILGVVSPYSLFLAPAYVRRKFQLWRLFTSLVYGTGGFGYIFDLVMLYRSLDDLERNQFHLRSADLIWQTLVSSGALLFITIPLRPPLLWRPFLIMFIYLSSKCAPPSAKTSIYGLITIPVAYYPWLLIAFDLIIGGPGLAALSVTGAMTGHLWWWSVFGGNIASQGRYARWGRAPEFLRKLMDNRPDQGRRAEQDARGGAAAGLAQGGIHVTAPRGRRFGNENIVQHRWGSGNRLGGE